MSVAILLHGWAVEGEEVSQTLLPWYNLLRVCGMSKQCHWATVVFQASLFHGMERNTWKTQNDM